jgi:hypothetical protein
VLITMKYVLVFVLLTCVLSSSIKERVETAATERAEVQEGTTGSATDITDMEECEWANAGIWICIDSLCECWL